MVQKRAQSTTLYLLINNLAILIQLSSNSGRLARRPKGAIQEPAEVEAIVVSARRAEEIRQKISHDKSLQLSVNVDRRRYASCFLQTERCFFASVLQASSETLKIRVATTSAGGGSMSAGAE